MDESDMDQVDQALTGLRVVDFSQFIAGPLAAVQFADLGAAVIRVDRPGGPRWRDPANALLQRGKRSIVLDLTKAEDAAIARVLIDAADVVFESWRPGVADKLGVGPAESLARNPGLVYCSIPGFAHDDPRAALPGWEGVVTAAAGLYPQRAGGEPGEPRFTALPMASSFAAIQACHAVMAALIARERTGVGQHVEVALFDAAFELLGGGAQKVGDAPPVPQGGAAPATMPQIGHYQCADARWVQLCLVQPRHLEWFVQTFLPGHVEDGWTDAGRVVADETIRNAMRAELTALMATRPALEWERLINETSGAPTGLCQTTEDWLRHDQHARDSRAVVEVPGDPELGLTVQAGHPIALSVTPPRAAGPRHALDADRAQILAEVRELAGRPASRRPVIESGPLPRPLAGTKVVDISQVLAGPTSARILADYGADVVKINSPQDRQHFQHVYTNSGKRSILLDLKLPEGMDAFWRLIDDADVLVENFTRGVAERMGIGEQDVRARRPGIVYSKVSAFGHEGYRGGYRGREELGQAVTGLQMRWFGRETPRMVFYALNDYGAGNWSAFATLVALYHRARTGRGQLTHSSLAHAATFHQTPFMVWFEGRVWDEPSGEDAPGWGPLDRMYRASDRWFYLAAHSARDRAAVRTVTGLSGLDLDGDPVTVVAALATAFSSSPAQEWVRELSALGVGASVVLNQEEVMDSELARARGLSLLRSLPSGEPIRTVGPARRLSLTPVPPSPVPGPPGSDAAAVLAGIGLAGALDELVEKSVILPQLPPDADFIGRFRPPSLAPASASGDAAVAEGSASAPQPVSGPRIKS
jgi:crotonobetainyl-CoA:carnitine CoA-transferase CaiB-like acyl-CoA transferase